MWIVLYFLFKVRYTKSMKSIFIRTLFFGMIGFGFLTNGVFASGPTLTAPIGNIALLKFALLNVGNCSSSISSTYSGATFGGGASNLGATTPSLGSALYASAAGSFSQTLTQSTPGATYTISCTGNIGSDREGLITSDSVNLIVTSPSPTSLPVLSINNTSGLTSANFTLNWTASNNSPTYYVMNITGTTTSGDLNQGNVLTWGPGSISSLGLGAGTYNFTVHACNASGCSGNSNQVTYTATAAPAVQINFSLLEKIKLFVSDLLINKVFASAITK
jgi:hypothetical protein